MCIFTALHRQAMNPNIQGRCPSHLSINPFICYWYRLYVRKKPLEIDSLYPRFCKASMLAPFFAGIAAASNLDGAATLPMHGVYPPAYVHFHSLNQIKLYFQHIVVVLPRQHGALISSRWFRIPARGLALSNRIPTRPFWFSWDVGWSLKIVPSLKISQRK